MVCVCASLQRPKIMAGKATRSTRLDTDMGTLINEGSLLKSTMTNGTAVMEIVQYANGTRDKMAGALLRAMWFKFRSDENVWIRAQSTPNTKLIDLVGLGVLSVIIDEKDPTSCYIGDGICLGPFTSSLARQLHAAHFEPVGFSNGWHGPLSAGLRAAMVQGQLVPGALKVSAIEQLALAGKA